MKELPERFFGFFKRYIYIIAVVVAVVSFGWIRKKIKSSFLGDIRGKKKKKGWRGKLIRMSSAFYQ